jgi:hypothetical protein
MDISVPAVRPSVSLAHGPRRSYLSHLPSADNLPCRLPSYLSPTAASSPPPLRTKAIEDPSSPHRSVRSGREAGRRLHSLSSQVLPSVVGPACQTSSVCRPSPPKLTCEKGARPDVASQTHSRRRPTRMSSGTQTRRGGGVVLPAGATPVFCWPARQTRTFRRRGRLSVLVERRAAGLAGLT